MSSVLKPGTPNTVDATLLPLAAYGLAGSLLEVPAGPFAPHQWFELLQECRTLGLVGLLAQAGKDGHLELSEAQADELMVQERETAGLALLVEQETLRMSGLLAASGLDHRLLGGSPRARLGYREPASRSYATATLLVAPDGLRTLPGMLDEAQGRVVVRDEVVAQEARVVLSQLAQPAALLALADRPVPTASLAEHLVLTCIECAASTESTGWYDPDASPLMLHRDVAELVLSPTIEADRVRQVAQSLRVIDVVAHAITETWDLFELADRTSLSVWAEREDIQRPRRGARPSGRTGRAGRTGRSARRRW